jgi:O-antigen biosynthesis protein
MRSVSVGIYADEQPKRITATIASLSAHTSQPFELVILGDGPDEETRRALQELANVEQSSTQEPRGAAACFNRLTRWRRSDVYIFLESGAQPATGWLDRILSAFDRMTRCGLAGPSTNRAWTEQCIVPQLSGLEDDPERVARSAARRFGPACRSLGPLHSLGDFCYAVRREVIETIGDADEAYGTGPCWEMDYTVRAARAGFVSIWVCAAYVQRAPLTARRCHEERAKFVASKHRYQDKFCGLRLRGQQSDYRDHCRGEACRNFAPRDLIEIAIPAAPPPSVISTSDGEALASCIMPTYNRRRFLPRALRSFLAQDYPNLELLVVDDGTDPIPDLLPDDPRIRYFRLDEKQTVGAKRNFACSQARGEYIVHWDDDDWYPPDRVRRQISTLRLNGAEVCGSSTVFYYSESINRAFRYQYPGPVPVWMGALAYPTEVWRSCRFEPIQVAEDVKFLSRIPFRKRADLKDPSLYVAFIHDANVSPKVIKGPCWLPENIEALRLIAGQELLLPSDRPEVSCIMPTYNRRRFIPLALACFQSQTCPSKELIVVDDGEDSAADLLAGNPGVVYLRLPRRASIGAKRNLACERARGEYIAHWDDDDWYAPGRLERQLEPLRAQTHDLTGLAGSFVLEMPGGEFWATTPEMHRRMFVGDIHGGTLLFRRSLWQNGIRYPDLNLAEDAALIRRATTARHRILRLENAGSFVYLRHAHNTWKFQSGTFLDPSGWIRTKAPFGFSPELLEAYRAASLDNAGAISVAPVLRQGEIVASFR